MKTSGYLLATLAALGAGIVVGMLLAPEKGSVTRKKIIEKGDDLVDSVGDKIGEKMNEVVQEVSKFTHKKQGSLIDSRKEMV